MTVVAVLWDFSATLMYPEPASRWVAGALADAGLRVAADEQAKWALRASAAGFPGPETPKDTLAPDQLSAWRHRALDPDMHRGVYRRLLIEAGLPWPEAATALYHRHMAAAGWEAYPDAADVLDRLRAAGIPSAVVSNIGWDIRVPLRAAGLLRRLETVVCSCEEGLRKPDPRLFQVACERLGVEPARTLMVGDSPRSDTGGESLGIKTLLVTAAPPATRPNGLRPVLTEAGLV